MLGAKHEYYTSSKHQNNDLQRLPISKNLGPEAADFAHVFDIVITTVPQTENPKFSKKGRATTIHFRSINRPQNQKRWQSWI